MEPASGTRGRSVTVYYRESRLFRAAPEKTSSPGTGVAKTATSERSMPRLSKEEYIEQAYLFRALLERIPDATPLQDLLVEIKQELLTTTRLPMALDFLLAEVRHLGVLNTAMKRLGHYFHPFQTYVISEAESERGRFDMRVALQLLHDEAKYRASEGSVQGLFFYQFECLCRNRLKYEQGLDAVAEDPWYDQGWRDWIVTVRRQIGLVDFADMVYVRSEQYIKQQQSLGIEAIDRPPAVLFGEKEGRIAFANRRKDPLYFFAALQRHLGYPEVKRPKPIEDTQSKYEDMQRKMHQLDIRLKLLEEEQRAGIDLNKYYAKQPPPQE